MVDVGLFVGATIAGFAVTMAAWFIVWGVSKAISIFKLVTKV